MPKPPEIPKKVSGLSKKLLEAAKKPKPAPPVWTVDPTLLLCQNTPQPMHSVVPREILGRAWWDKYRKEIYKSTDYHCQACGIHKYEAKLRQWLEGHEVYEIDYVKGRMKFKGAVALCHCCHSYIHDGRLENLLMLGKISHAKFSIIVQHGDAVLAKAGLVRPSKEEREEAIKKLVGSKAVARWEDWRLELNGKLYPPIYENYAHWLKAMGH